MGTTVHLGLRGKGSLYGFVIHACNGRASSSLLSVTDDVEKVTCKRCLKGLAVRNPPKPYGVWHVISDEIGTILGVYGEALIEDARASAKDHSAKTMGKVYVHHIRGERPSVGQTISMKDADDSCDVIETPKFIEYTDPRALALLKPDYSANPAAALQPESVGHDFVPGTGRDADVCEKCIVNKPDHWVNPAKAKNAQTRTTTHNDGKFIRTALVVGGGDNQGSVDVVDADGRRLAQVNLFWTGEGRHLIIDVIDVDDRFDHKRALTFSQTDRRMVEVPKGGNLVSVDFMDTLTAEEG